MFLAYFCLFIAAISVWSYRTFGLAGVSVGDYIEATDTELMPAIVANEEIEYVEPVVAKEKVVAPDIDVGTKCKSNVRLDLVNHAYKISNGNMKFIGTIAAESMFDVNSKWDGWKSFWLCQFHRVYQPDNNKAYRELKTDFEKLEFCHEKYDIWDKKGILHKRLYWVLVWKEGLKKLNISCNN